MKDEYTDYIRKKEKKGYKLVKTDFSVSEQGDCYKASGNITWQKKQTHYEKIKKVKQKGIINMAIMETVLEIPAEHERNIFGSFDANIKK